MSQKKSSKRYAEIQNLLTLYAQEANEWAQFSQRETRLTAPYFVQTLVLGWLKNKKASLNELAHAAQDLGLQITGSALQERMDQPALLLLAGVLHLALKQLRKACPLPLNLLAPFGGIYISDSSQIALPQALAALFQGNKGNSMLKLQVVWDVSAWQSGSAGGARRQNA